MFFIILTIGDFIWEFTKLWTYLRPEIRKQVLSMEEAVFQLT